MEEFCGGSDRRCEGRRRRRPGKVADEQGYPITRLSAALGDRDQTLTPFQRLSCHRRHASTVERRGATTTTTASFRAESLSICFSLRRHRRRRTLFNEINGLSRRNAMRMIYTILS